MMNSHMVDPRCFIEVVGNELRFQGVFVRSGKWFRRPPADETNKPPAMSAGSISDRASLRGLDLQVI
jgi:hypothetical protein